MSSSSAPYTDAVSSADQPGSSRKHRKINRTLPQLKRNAACVPCRKRRVKCDGARPLCSSCIRSFQFLARTQPDPERDGKGVQCHYDDGGSDDDVEREKIVTPKIVGEKRKLAEEEEDQSAAIRSLEAKVAELQNALLMATPEASSRSSSRPLPSYAETNPNPNANINVETLWPPISNQNLDVPLQTTHLQPSYQTPYPTNVTPMPIQQQRSLSGMSQDYYQSEMEPEEPKAVTQESVLDAEAGQLGGPFVDIFWPGWPRRLPTPNMLDHLVYTFFNAMPTVSRFLHRQSFMARLALPPRHHDFPHVALLHAICAGAARYSAAVRVSSVQELVEKSLQNPPAELAPGRSSLDEEAFNEKCFAERHWKYALLEIRYDNCKGTKLLELLQAQVILNQFIVQTAKWLDGWIMAGAMTRTAIALGLFDEDDEFSQNGERIRHGILPPATTDAEREERRALVCELIAIQASFSASGNWPTTMPDDELFFHFPGARADFLLNEKLPENPQTIAAVNLYIDHPVEDGYVMYIKASYLLVRVTRFIRRLRRMNPTEKHLAKGMGDFTELERDLSDFNLTFPTSLRDPLQTCPGYSNRIDADLINAHCTHRVASILLHEPFADLSDPQSPSGARILSEARAILGIIYLIMSTSTDMALMLLPTNSGDWFYHAARILVLFYHHALEIGDTVTARSYLAEIEVFQMAFSALGNRFALGAVHCGMIDTMVRKIHEEFGLPEQSWKWSPRDWIGAPSDSGALNFQAGMRSVPKRNLQHLPALPLTHPDGMAWEQRKGGRLTYRQIFDQQRSFVGRSPKSQSQKPPAFSEYSSDAGTYPVPTLGSFHPR